MLVWVYILYAHLPESLITVGNFHHLTKQCTLERITTIKSNNTGRLEMLTASHLNIFEVPCWILSKKSNKENI